jgi:HEPN domain-containing protein
MPQRTEDWLKQARRDLEHARMDLMQEFYEWACFSAQQASEKALKALYQNLSEYFTEKEAKEAVEYADKIIRFCENNIS